MRVGRQRYMSRILQRPIRFNVMYSLSKKANAIKNNKGEGLTPGNNNIPM